MIMKCNYRHEVYRTGSVSGYVERDREDYTPKKFTYIKIKADRYYYLGEDGKLVSENHAAPFTPQIANYIVMSIRKDARYKNYTVEPFETSTRLSEYTEPFNEAPQDLIKVDSTSKTDDLENEQIKFPIAEKQPEEKNVSEQIKNYCSEKQPEEKFVSEHIINPCSEKKTEEKPASKQINNVYNKNDNSQYNDKQQTIKSIFIGIGVGIFIASVIIALIVSLVSTI